MCVPLRVLGGTLPEKDFRVQMQSEPIVTLLRECGARTAVLTDAEGAVLLRAGDIADELPELQRMAVTYAQSAEHASKLGFGKNMSATAFYGMRARTKCTLYVFALSSVTLTIHFLLFGFSSLTGKATVVHIYVPPLVLSLLADSDANVGLMLDVIPQLCAAVEPLRSAAEGANLRSTYSGVAVQ